MTRILAVLHRAFHEPDTRLHRVVSSIVWGLIAVALLLFVVDFTLSRDGVAPRFLKRIDTVILWIFVAEISLRVVSYRPPELAFFSFRAHQIPGVHLRARLRYLMQPYNLIDLLTVVALVPELRGLRALRLLQLLRGVHFFRYANPLGVAARAFHESRLLYYVAFTILGIEVMVGGMSIYLIEGQVNPTMKSTADGIWWALVTLTTVGFGDISPVTALGRAIGGILMVGGMFTLAMFAGIAGHTLLHGLMGLREEQYRMSSNIGHIVVCGYDPGARLLLDALLAEIETSAMEVVLFAPGQRPQDVPPEFTWVPGDPTKESELDKARLGHAAAAIVVGPRTVVPQQADAQTILTVFTLRRYMARRPEAPIRNRPMYVIAEILDAENVDHARAAGADEVIETTRLGFSLLAHAVVMPGTAEVMGRVATSGAHSLYVGRLPAEAPRPRTFGAVSDWLKSEHGALAIGFRDPGSDSDRLNPPDDTVIPKGWEIVYLAESAVFGEPISSPVPAPPA